MFIKNALHTVELGTQLLIETGVEAKVIDQIGTIKKAVVVETGVDWLQRGPLSLWLWPSTVNRRKVETLSINNELVTSHGFGPRRSTCER